MNEQEVLEYWTKSAKEDLLTAEALFAGKRYHHCLFFCHLVIEKILKALCIKQNHDAPPWTHDLNKLAQGSGQKITEKMQKDLREIGRFNITARYDDYKFAFYKKATKEFTTTYLHKAKEIYTWFKEKL